MRVRFKGAISKVSSLVSKLFKIQKPDHGELAEFTSEKREDDISATQSHPMTPRLIHEDILVQIFLALSKDAYISNRQFWMDFEWDWVCVAEVCRYWRRIATGTPELWSYLDAWTFHSAERTARHLLQSKNADLTVECTISCSQIDNLKKALKEMRRIRHIFIEITIFNGEDLEDVEELLLLLDQPAPRAKSIKLNMPKFSIQPRFFFPIAWPGVLQNLKLYSLTFISSMTHLSGLTSLDIRYCNNFSLLELLEVLEKSPRLSSLSIISCDIRPSSISRSVHMPYLLKIHIELTSFSEIYELLFDLEAPNLLRWKVSCQENLTADNIENLDVLSLLPTQKECCCISILASKSSDERSMLIIGCEEPFAPRSKEATMKFPFDSTDLDIAFRRMVDILSTQLARAEKLKIRDPEDLLVADTWRTVFRMCSSARTVEVELGLWVENKDDGMQCLKALGSSRSADFGEEYEVPCSSLDHISVMWYGLESNLDQFLSALEDVLSARVLHGLAVCTLSVRSILSA